MVSGWVPGVTAWGFRIITVLCLQKVQVYTTFKWALQALTSGKPIGKVCNMLSSIKTLSKHKISYISTMNTSP